MKYEKEVDRLLKDKSLEHLLAGLAAETGEVLGIQQKSLYKKQEIDSEHMVEELGDVMFYLTALCNYYDVSLSDLQALNLHKLFKRHSV